MTSAQHQPNQDSASSSSNEVKTDTNVTDILNNISDQNTRLHASIHYQDGRTYSFTTRLVAVNERHQIIHLANPHSSKLITNIKPGDQIALRCQYLGALMESTVIYLDTESTQAPYRLITTMPEKITLTHKRGSIRKTITRENSCSLQLSSANGTSSTVPVDNISATGCGLLSHTIRVEYFKVGQHLTGLTLNLDNTSIQCDAEIRFVQQESSEAPVRVGLKFLNLRANDESSISRWIANEMRLELKEKRHLH